MDAQQEGQKVCLPRASHLSGKRFEIWRHQVWMYSLEMMSLLLLQSFIVWSCRGNFSTSMNIKLYIPLDQTNLLQITHALELFMCMRLFVTPWTIAHQASLSMGFARQEDWHELQFPPPGDLPHPGIKPVSPASPALAGGFFTTEPPE